MEEGKQNAFFFLNQHVLIILVYLIVMAMIAIGITVIHPVVAIMMTQIL